MWIDKLNINQFEKWLSNRITRIPSGNRDPYSSSMRSATRFISALNGSAESRMAQQLTDLASAQLYDRNLNDKSILAKSLLKRCSQFLIPDTDELAIVLTLFLEALHSHNEFYKDIVKFWYNISKKIPMAELSEHIDISYLLSYLSVGDKEELYVPLQDIVNCEDFRNLSSFDILKLNELQLSTNAKRGILKLLENIRSYTTRSARKQMFQAFDIMFSFDKISTIDRICPFDNFPSENKLLRNIIGAYYSYFSFSSLLYDTDKFCNMSILINLSLKDKPLQQIYYGAPGTGKSHETNKIAKTFPNTIRTTFHPDSDYSTFVGAYKPTTTTNYKYGLDRDGNTVPIGLNADENGKTIPFEEKKVEYKFVKQSFLKAYIKAWKSFKETCVDGGEIAPQFLIIEEINRGNCAQIFGDLFQLLDRNKEGFSEYPIETDEDIVKALLEDKPEDKLSFGMKGLELLPEQMNYINSVFNKDSGLELNVAEKICKGEVLVLPCNFYIWATMNTSDQSLFPIDSAFKRRWEWKYMKIREGKDENGEVLNWKIIVKDKDKNNVNILGREDLSWWEFIQKINEIIASMTLSADKQLGYFFCKAKEGVIDERTFVGKVIFYLWNDVFKDYGFEDSYLFRYKTTVNGNEVEKDLTFPDFYDEDGENIDSVRLVDFIERIMNWKKTNQEND